MFCGYKKGVIMNIIKSLQTQLEQGKNYIDFSGAILSGEKIEKNAKKQYANGIKSCEINPAEISFTNFLATQTADYLTVEELINYISGAEQEPEPEPFEPDENEIPAENEE